MWSHKKLAMVAGLLFLSGIVLNAVSSRIACSYYGSQTEQETRYVAFYGCMVKTAGIWTPIKKLYVVQSQESE